jgi:hypothetical protein
MGSRRARRGPRTVQQRKGAFYNLNDRKIIEFSTVDPRSGDLRESRWMPFAPDGDVLYVLEERGKASPWVQDLFKAPAAMVERLAAVGRIVESEDEAERARMLCRQRFPRIGLAAADIIETSLVVAFDARDATDAE